MGDCRNLTTRMALRHELKRTRPTKLSETAAVEPSTTLSTAASEESSLDKLSSEPNAYDFMAGRIRKRICGSPAKNVRIAEIAGVEVHVKKYTILKLINFNDALGWLSAQATNVILKFSSW